MIRNSLNPRLPSTLVVPSGLHDSGHQNLVSNLCHPRWRSQAGCLPVRKTPKMDCRKARHNLRALESKDLLGSRQGEDSDFDEDDANLCPVDCVREFKTDAEFHKILERAKETNSLVVVDFYRTSCGSCKYIEQGFTKLCKGSGDQQASVVFLKHNVIDEYDEQSEVAERLRIKAVPLFHFYRDGVLLEAFPTRDKERILAAIQKYTSAS